MARKRPIGRLVTTIMPDGTITTEVLPKAPEYTFWQRKVEGYIEIVPGFNRYLGRPATVYSNENSISEGRVFNPIASQLWKDTLLRRDPKAKFWYEPQLYGTVVIDQVIAEPVTDAQERRASEPVVIGGGLS